MVVHTLSSEIICNMSPVNKIYQLPLRSAVLSTGTLYASCVDFAVFWALIDQAEIGQMLCYASLPVDVFRFSLVSLRRPSLDI